VDYSRIITMEPGKRSGKPCIRGLRMTVGDVLGYLASGMTHAEILRDFPYLTEEDIRACLAFAADRPGGPRQGAHHQNPRRTRKPHRVAHGARHLNHQPHPQIPKE
jgi:uncharacterized protein (DUF433 family)